MAREKLTKFHKKLFMVYGLHRTYKLNVKKNVDTVEIMRTCLMFRMRSQLGKVHERLNANLY